jgi:hypothetical protein
MPVLIDCHLINKAPDPMNIRAFVQKAADEGTKKM